MRYDDLCDRLKRYSPKCLSDRLDSDFAEAVQEAVEVLKDAKSGEWINTMPIVEYKSFCQVKCSICESVEPYGKFCRNCGARME